MPAFIGAAIAAAASEPLASPWALLPAADSLVAAKGDAPFGTEAAFINGGALAADVATAAAPVMDGAEGEDEAPDAPDGPNDPDAPTLADALDNDDACGPDAPADAA